MKFLLILIISLASFSEMARAADKIKLGTNVGTKKVEVRFKSKYKKNTAAIFTVTDGTGKTISTMNSHLLCGDNSVCLCEVLDLADGEYTVTMVSKNKTYSSKFIIWKDNL